jgi:hypothetical protein
VAAKRQCEDDLAIAVGHGWRSGDDDRCSLPGPLVLQERQFLSHPAKHVLELRDHSGGWSDQIHCQRNSGLARSAMRSGRSSGIQWPQLSTTSRVKSDPWASISSSTATGI